MEKENWNIIGLKDHFMGWVLNDEDLDYDENQIDDGAMFIVEFDTFTVDFGNNIDGNQCEIIGNIFDNPELLKGEEND